MTQQHDKQPAKILVVLTSHDTLGSDTTDSRAEKTGFWLEEFAAPYYVFVDAGAQLTVASPAGGQPPIDPKSEAADFQTDATRRFNQDDAAQHVLANTCKLAELDQAEFDAVFYPGGHGPLWDLTNDQHSIALIEAFVSNNKVVSAVCHASAVFLHAKGPDGQSLVKGKAVTGFSNTEEAAVQLTDIVPFLLEDELKVQGGNYQSGADWMPFVLQDGLLITGQNPASSALVAQKLLQHLSGE